MMQLTLFLFMIAVSATRGELIPSGSYQKSCSNCRVNEDKQKNKVLECNCENGLDESNPLFTLNKASMKLDDDWICQDIYNLKGKLICVGEKEDEEWDAGVGWGMIPLPAGTYQRSCNNCRVIPGKNEVLKCECLANKNSAEVNTAESYLELGNGWTCKDIYNLKGELVCVGQIEEAHGEARLLHKMIRAASK